MNSPEAREPAASDLAWWRDPVLWVIVALALALRIGYNLALHPDGHPISTFVIDEREYFASAHTLAEGRGFSFFDTALWIRPPLYVMFLAAIFAALDTAYQGIVMAQGIVSAATIVPLAWLAYHIAGRRAGRISAAVAALYLPFTLFSGLLLSETLFLFFFALSLVGLVLAREALGGAVGSRPVLWSAGAGLLLGLAILTRSTALAFVPLAAAWLAWRRGNWRDGLIAAAVFVAACVLSLAPWTARNYVAYHSVVLVDTTSGYNLWLASVGVRGEERLQADLRPLSGPVERQSFAFARAWENISSDPLKFIGKGLKESVDLWRPSFSAEERQTKGFTLGRVPAWHLLSLFLLDDLLYLVILLASLAGLLVFPPHPLKWLVGLWVLLWVVMSFVFFAVTRFRLPVVAALAPWAGIGLSSLWSSWGGLWARVRSRRAVHVAPLVAGLAALVGIGWVVAASIPLGDTLLGIGRWNQQDGFRRGEDRLAGGDVPAAIASYVTANQEIADTRYGLAAAYLQSGDTNAALSELSTTEPPDRFEPFILRGEAARRAGDLAAARTFFNAREVRVAGEPALDWAWDHLRPPPTTRIEIGSGLDIGYIRGFHTPETASDGTIYRWTSEQTEVRGLSATDQVTTRWSGWRPQGLPQAVALVERSGSGAASQQAAASYSLLGSDTWETGTLGGLSAQSTQLTMSFNAFIASGSDPRLLGARVSSIGSAP